MLLFFLCPPPTHTYTLSLHDALPICIMHPAPRNESCPSERFRGLCFRKGVGLSHCHPNRVGRLHPSFVSVAEMDDPPFLNNPLDRKSTRLNSSHEWISYAVFCLKKKR